MKSEHRHNCFKCQHFFITYDKKFPYGCNAFSLKSRVMPATEVYHSSGHACLLFKLREKKTIKD